MAPAVATNGDLLRKLKISSGKPLGCGSFAAVHKATWEGRPCAVKVLLPKHANAPQKPDRPDCPAAMLRREGAALVRHPHRYLAGCYAILELPPGFPGLLPGYTCSAPALVLELLERGSLSCLLKRQMVTPWNHLYDNATALDWALQAASALAHLHGLSPPVLHRDVKLDNVMLKAEAEGCGEGGGSGGPVAKLVDLGLHVVPAHLPEQLQQPLFRAAMSARASGLSPSPFACTSATDAIAAAAGVDAGSDGGDGGDAFPPPLERATYSEFGRGDAGAGDRRHAAIRRCINIRTSIPGAPAGGAAAAGAAAGTSSGEAAAAAAAAAVFRTSNSSPLFFTRALGNGRILPVDPKSPGLRNRNAALIVPEDPVLVEVESLDWRPGRSSPAPLLLPGGLRLASPSCQEARPAAEGAARRACRSLQVPVPEHSAQPGARDGDVGILQPQTPSAVTAPVVSTSAPPTPPTPAAAAAALPTPFQTLSEKYIGEEEAPCAPPRRSTTGPVAAAAAAAAGGMANTSLLVRSAQPPPSLLAHIHRAAATAAGATGAAFSCSTPNWSDDPRSISTATCSESGIRPDAILTQCPGSVLHAPAAAEGGKAGPTAAMRPRADATADGDGGDVNGRDSGGGGGAARSAIEMAAAPMAQLGLGCGVARSAPPGRTLTVSCFNCHMYEMGTTGSGGDGGGGGGGVDRSATAAVLEARRAVSHLSATSPLPVHGRSPTFAADVAASPVAAATASVVLTDGVAPPTPMISKTLAAIPQAAAVDDHDFFNILVYRAAAETHGSAGTSATRPLQGAHSPTATLSAAASEPSGPVEAARRGVFGTKPSALSPHTSARSVRACIASGGSVIHLPLPPPPPPPLTLGHHVTTNMACRTMGRGTMGRGNTYQGGAPLLRPELAAEALGPATAAAAAVAAGEDVCSGGGGGDPGGDFVGEAVSRLLPVQEQPSPFSFPLPLPGGGSAQWLSTGDGGGMSYNLPLESVYRLTGATGSHMTMAPEVFLGLPYNEKADVFSFGVLLYELFSRSMLVVTHLNTRQPGLRHVLKLPEQYAEAVSRGYRPARAACVPDPVWHLITRCWHQDPLMRPAMTQVVARLSAIRAHLDKGGGGGGGTAGTRGTRGGSGASSSGASCGGGGGGGGGSTAAGCVRMGFGEPRSPRVRLEGAGCSLCVIS